jgi:ribosome-binding factor A
MRPVDIIKRARRESLLQKVIAKLLAQQSLDDSELQGVFVNRIGLNANKSICTVYFYSDLGEEHFKKVLGRLILYKPSLRAAVAREVSGKYVPELVFRFDNQLTKQLAIEELIESVKEEE